MYPNDLAQSWYRSAVVYRIYPRSFCDCDGDGIGEVAAIISKLDYLAQLGVDTLRLAVDDATYSAETDVTPPEGFCRLAKAAHARNMRVLVDMPLASTSDQHPWFVQSTADSPYRDYYIYREGRGKRAPDNRKVDGRSAWQLAADGHWYMHEGDLHRPLLNWHSDKMREEMGQLAEQWLLWGADGLCVDIVHVCPTADGTRGGFDTDAAIGYVREMVRTLRRNCECALVVDVGTLPPSAIGGLTFADGIAFAEHIQDRVQHIEHAPNLRRIKHAFSRWQTASFGRFCCDLYWGTPSSPRAVNLFAGAYTDYRREAACTLATIQAMLYGTPVIYQGEEIGMTDYPYNDIRTLAPALPAICHSPFVCIPFINRWLLGKFAHRVGDNARTAMQWTSVLPNAGFSATTPSVPVNPNYTEINAQDALEDADSVFHYYRRLIELRRDARVADIIARGTYHEYYPTHKQLYVFARSYKGMTIVAVCNMCNDQVPFTVPNRIAFNDAELLIGNYEMPAHLGSVTLRPYESVVYRLK